MTIRTTRRRPRPSRSPHSPFRLTITHRRLSWGCGDGDAERRRRQGDLLRALCRIRHGRIRPPVVLVHGWGMSCRVWDTVLPVLLDAGHEVVSLDHRGCGASGQGLRGHVDRGDRRRRRRSRRSSPARSPGGERLVARWRRRRRGRRQARRPARRARAHVRGHAALRAGRRLSARRHVQPTSRRRSPRCAPTGRRSSPTSRRRCVTPMSVRRWSTGCGRSSCRPARAPTPPCAAWPASTTVAPADDHRTGTRDRRHARRHRPDRHRRGGRRVAAVGAPSPSSRRAATPRSSRRTPATATSSCASPARSDVARSHESCGE